MVRILMVRILMVRILMVRCCLPQVRRGTAGRTALRDSAVCPARQALPASRVTWACPGWRVSGDARARPAPAAAWGDQVPPTANSLSHQCRSQGVRAVRTHRPKIVLIFFQNMVISITQIDYGVDTCHKIIYSVTFFIFYWYRCRCDIKVNTLVYDKAISCMSSPQ